MNSLVSRVSYLKGLVEGLELDKTSKEGKVIVEITDILSEIASEVEYLKESQLDMEEYLDALDEDLEDVENMVYDDEIDECEDENDEFISVQCPYCGEVVYVEQDMFDDEEKIKCPNCNNLIDIHESCQCDNCCDDNK